MIMDRSLICDTSIGNMGFGLSRLDTASRLLDGSSSNDELRASPRINRQLHSIDNDIAQLTSHQSPQENFILTRPGKREYPISVVTMLAGREANLFKRGRFSPGDCRHVLSKYLPVNGPWVVDQMSTRAYVSQFSWLLFRYQRITLHQERDREGKEKGKMLIVFYSISRFFPCNHDLPIVLLMTCQGSQIRIYDVESGWKVRNNILARSFTWTITDAALSPDKRHLVASLFPLFQKHVYGSMSTIAYIVNVGSAAKESLANNTEHEDGGFAFGMFSLKFSTDGREIVAGSNDDDILYVYDLEAKKVSLRTTGHKSDVNTVCFADESGHL
ncbi:LEC14B protein-like isoform X2 [Salvia splendens]|uniref:LEC14B protein-like isoform X2 n=1 Tax=Salvia splendens TaxID=180675 RepID=UPI001C280621|nr:LEC14B protein-like isoform X2 [Salvia splendens]